MLILDLYQWIAQRVNLLVVMFVSEQIGLDGCALIHRDKGNKIMINVLHQCGEP